MDARVPPRLRADCARCDGLCCVSHAFDRSAWFGFDKPAGVPCPHLSPTSRCAIHASREPRGFAGCAAYDCHGAGQRVTALFAGRSWREGPALAGAMLRGFLVMREVHELLLLLDQAGRLTPAHAPERQRLVAQLDPAAGWTVETLAAFDVGRSEREVHAFLRALGPGVARARRRLRVAD
jgi:hypothetical protein